MYKLTSIIDKDTAKLIRKIFSPRYNFKRENSFKKYLNNFNDEQYEHINFSPTYFVNLYFGYFKNQYLIFENKAQNEQLFTKESYATKLPCILYNILPYNII